MQLSLQCLTEDNSKRYGKVGKATIIAGAHIQQPMLEQAMLDIQYPTVNTIMMIHHTVFSRQHLEREHRPGPLRVLVNI